MSGICAIWRRDHPEQVGEALSAVTEGLFLHPAERVDRLTDLNAGLGVSARFATQQVYQDSQVMVACDADLSNEKELRDSVGRRGETPPNMQRQPPCWPRFTIGSGPVL